MLTTRGTFSRLGRTIACLGERFTSRSAELFYIEFCVRRNGAGAPACPSRLSHALETPPFQPQGWSLMASVTRLACRARESAYRNSVISAAFFPTQTRLDRFYRAAIAVGYRPRTARHRMPHMDSRRGRASLSPLSARDATAPEDTQLGPPGARLSLAAPHMRRLTTWCLSSARGAPALRHGHAARPRSAHSLTLSLRFSPRRAGAIEAPAPRRKHNTPPRSCQFSSPARTRASFCPRRRARR